MAQYGWLSGEAAREYTRTRAEELRRLREESGLVLPDLEDPDASWEPGSDGFIGTRKTPDPSWPPPPESSGFGKPRSTPRYLKGGQYWFCPGCSKWVPRADMGIRKSRWNGLDYYCKACKTKMQKNTRMWSNWRKGKHLKDRKPYP